MQKTMLRKKRTYSTSVIVKAQAGELTAEEKKDIARSTRQDWKKRNLAKTYGYNCDNDFFQKIEFYKNINNIDSLVKANEALLSIHYFYSSLFENLKGKRRIRIQRKQEIVSLIKKIAPEFGVRRSCDFLQISIQKFYRWSKEIPCNSSLFNLCRKLNPKQLTLKEQKVVESYLKKPEFFHWPLRSIFYRMLRDGVAFMNLSTFYKYAGSFGISRYVRRKPKQKIGIRTDAPLKLLHMDTTIFRTSDNIRVYIHFIMDNFSRTILGWKASLKWSSRATFQNLKEVCEKYSLFYKPIQLLCDNGSENQGDVNEFLLEPNLSIEKLVAQVDISFSNSMIEAVNKRIKYEFLFRKELRSLEDVIRSLESDVLEYNNRPSGVLYGFTPLEVLNGSFPDKYHFSEKIKQANSERPRLNRANLCGVC